MSEEGKPELTKEFFYSIFNDYVFFFIMSSSGESCHFSLRKEHCNLKQVLFLINDALKNFSFKDTSSDIKIIGPQKNCLLIQKALIKHYRFNSINMAPREGTYEICFDPKKGFLQVSTKGSVPEQKKIKILIVDDSRVVRMLLNKIFRDAGPAFQVVGEAQDGLEVPELLQSLRPDVMTLDIQMPQSDGVEVLKSLPPELRIPTIVVSSISMGDGPLVIQAMENGAVDYIQKPELNHFAEMAEDVVRKIKMASTIHAQKIREKIQSAKIFSQGEIDPRCIVAIGSSTGGISALGQILPTLPANSPPILIVQHIPEIFSRNMAERFDPLCSVKVKEAVHGEPIRPGHVYLAQGGKQMGAQPKGEGLVISIKDAPPVNHFAPSVDYLFFSLAKCSGRHIIGVILTGMGHDGARGLLHLKSKGASTMAQDEGSSLIFGMPREAIRLGAAEFVEPLRSIPQRILKLASKEYQRQRRRKK